VSDKKYILGSIFFLSLFYLLMILFKGGGISGFVIVLLILFSLSFMAFGPYHTLMAKWDIKLDWKDKSVEIQKIRNFKRNLPKLVKIEFFITVLLIPLLFIVNFDTAQICFVGFPATIASALLGFILGVLFSSKVILPVKENKRRPKNKGEN
jgi:archaellum biogenesis protein FlaJ (TadC family)